MKTNNKPKALKNTPNCNNGFFRALLFGFLTCAVTWLLLTLVFALILSKQTDSKMLGSIFTPAIVVISLALGGFVSGKIDKSSAVLSAFLLGITVLGISYALSTLFDISRNPGALLKTVEIAVMFVCPIVGAVIATRKRKSPVRRKRKM